MPPATKGGFTRQQMQQRGRALANQASAVLAGLGFNQVSEQALQQTMRTRFRGDPDGLRLWQEAHQATLNARNNYALALSNYLAAAQQAANGNSSAWKSLGRLGQKVEDARQALISAIVSEQIAASGAPHCGAVAAEWCVKSKPFCGCEPDLCTCTLRRKDNDEAWAEEFQDRLRDGTAEADLASGGGRAPGGHFHPPQPPIGPDGGPPPPVPGETGSGSVVEPPPEPPEEVADAPNSDTGARGGKPGSRAGGGPVQPPGSPPAGPSRDEPVPKGPTRSEGGPVEEPQRNCGSCQEALAETNGETGNESASEAEAKIDCLWSALSQVSWKGHAGTLGLDRNAADRRALLKDLVSRCVVTVAGDGPFSVANWIDPCLKELAEIARMPKASNNHERIDRLRDLLTQISNNGMHAGRRSLLARDALAAQPMMMKGKDKDGNEIDVIRHPNTYANRLFDRALEICLGAKSAEEPTGGGGAASEDEKFLRDLAKRKLSTSRLPPFNPPFEDPWWVKFAVWAAKEAITSFGILKVAKWIKALRAADSIDNIADAAKAAAKIKGTKTAAKAADDVLPPKAAPKAPPGSAGSGKGPRGGANNSPPPAGTKTEAKAPSGTHPGIKPPKGADEGGAGKPKGTGTSEPKKPDGTDKATEVPDKGSRVPPRKPPDVPDYKDIPEPRTRADWPPNDGFTAAGKRRRTLEPGVEFDRWGREAGNWTSPAGTPWWKRSLPGRRRGYGRYRVVRPVNAHEGTVAPAFEQPGGGIQWQLDDTVEALLERGAIVRVSPFDPTAVPR